MRFKRTRYLIAFLAAMFLANSVAAAAYASFAPLAGEVPAAAGEFGAVDGEHFMGPDTDPCLTHCVQGYTHYDQYFAVGAPPGLALPVRFAVSYLRKPAPVDPVIARAPMILGPPLTILFRNFRN